jgi:hypothetical protein
VNEGEPQDYTSDQTGAPTQADDGGAPEGTAAPPHVSVPAPAAVGAEPLQNVPTPAPADPSFRLSKLAPANRAPEYVKPDAPLAEAITLMMSRDYFQVPVITSERDVKGVISWQSIATRLALSKRSRTGLRSGRDA